MGNRIETPDILAEIMGGNGKAIKQESRQTIKHKKNKTINHSSSNKGNEKNESKEKSTFNLSTNTLEKLEDTWISLRRQIKDKGRITKTLIVERAIELAIEDLKKKGKASFLFQDLSNQ